jgi:hypothetical protein
VSCKHRKSPEGDAIGIALPKQVSPSSPSHFSGTSMKVTVTFS